MKMEHFRGFGEQMDSTLRIKNDKYFGVNFQPKEGNIHVLVVVSEEITKLQLLNPRDSSNGWLSLFLAKSIEFHLLPFVGSLTSFIKQPLPVKIRAKKGWVEKWSLNPELQEKLFVIDDAAPCMEFKSMIFVKRQLRLLRHGRTACSFIWAWDSVIRNVVDLLFTRAQIDRGSCNSSSTGTKRPDFSFVLDRVCVFRGEEESPVVSKDVSIEELRSRIMWTYGSVPYVFGYATSGYNIVLLALHRDEEGVVATTTIGTFNIELKEHRFEVVLATLNLSLLFSAIVAAGPASGKGEYRDLVRSSGVVVHLFPTFVKKVFPDTGNFYRLKQVYAHMEQAGVSNVDRLAELNYEKRTAVFEPRGTMVGPSNLLELFGALRDVLEALVDLHRLGWMHRDIRWSNVIRQREQHDSWFLIDFVSGQHLGVEEHE